MEDSKVVDISKPTLLCISDLEGCLETSFPANIPQSRELCKGTTFDAIGKLLESNDQLQVAFLGDYFDQGNMMKESIAGIVGLKDLHGDRVHIILGNRDINKMRICVEDHKAVGYSGPNMWTTWKDFLYGNVENGEHSQVGSKPFYNPDLEQVERCKQLLKNTYGAPNLLSYAGESDENLGFNRMRAIFSEVNGFVPDDFVTNCRKLFYHGELIKVITVGNTKVLVSHAGTNNANIFKFNGVSDLKTKDLETKDFINFDNSLFSYDIEKYFDSIETARQLLQTPLETDTNFNISIKAYNQLYNDLVYAVIDVNGKLLKDLPELLDETDNPLKSNYFLLQAMGLKADTSNTGNFLSPIESCGLSGGCKNFNAFPPEFGKVLTDNGIEAIAHGHIPFCGTVPLIHGEIVDEKTIGVLSCDTSNGNRPDTLEALDQIPLGYIQEDGIGIASILQKDESVSLSRENTKGYKNDGNEPDLYKPMIGHFPYDKLPTLDTSRTSIKYGETTFQFGSTQFQPLEKKVTGGKSRKIRRKGRRTRKLRRTKKTRYLKHKCSHRCRH
jgi:hypothetical protein